MVLLIVAVVVGSLTPSVLRILTRARINRAAGVVAADFYLAQSLAARTRTPMTVFFSSSNKTGIIRLASSSTTVYQTRYYGSEGEFKLPTFSASPASVNVLPSGMTSASITVSLSDGTFTRQVRMSRAGQIRILP